MNLKAVPLIIIYLVLLSLVYLVFGTTETVFMFAAVCLILLGVINILGNKNKLTRYISSFMLNNKSTSLGLIISGITLILLLTFK